MTKQLSDPARNLQVIHRVTIFNLKVPLVGQVQHADEIEGHRCVFLGLEIKGVEKNRKEEKRRVRKIWSDQVCSGDW